MTRIKIHRGKPFRDVLDQWARNDGSKRAQRVASAMRSGAGSADPEYSRNIIITEDKHPTRISFHIGSLYKGAGKVEADTGNAVRSLGAARGR